jgi:hypothetical protein
MDRAFSKQTNPCIKPYLQVCPLRAQIELPRLEFFDSLDLGRTLQINDGKADPINSGAYHDLFLDLEISCFMSYHLSWSDF